jgi:CDP-glucose 4,6-dehydratase
MLELGAQVVALVRDWNPQSELIRSGNINRCSVISGSLEQYATLERALVKHEVDTVFHLGAQAIVGSAFRSPLATYDANIRGTYNLLEACRLHRDQVQRVVVASSDKAYGESAVLPYTEDMPANGRHPYDVSKSCTDLLAMTSAQSYGLPVTIARCGNIFGGGDLNWSRIVPGTIRMALSGQVPLIRSDGTFTRDYIFIEDVVTAYLSLAEVAAKPGVQGEAFNFSPERPVSVLEMVQAILVCVGREDLKPIIQNRARAEIRGQYLDAQKARQSLGWSPAYSLEAGLAATVAWYRNYLGDQG